MQGVELIGGIPAFSIGDRLIRGASMIANGNVERGLEQALPPVISNPLKALRYYTEGATTMKGDQVAEPVGVAGAISRSIGFEPASVAEAKELQKIAAGSQVAVFRFVAENLIKWKMLRKFIVLQPDKFRIVSQLFNALPPFISACEKNLAGPIVQYRIID